MFNNLSSGTNSAFNNTSFTQCSILFMESAKEMHPSMRRFYEAMKALKGIEGQSAVAKALNVSPQKLNNWEARGMSAEAAIEIECTIGCRAAWLRNGNGEMLSPNVVIEGYARRVTDPAPVGVIDDFPDETLALALAARLADKPSEELDHIVSTIRVNVSRKKQLSSPPPDPLRNVG